ncbi:hypothetical protein NL676_018670 [Syzygium grande]|nr:hypothetical protein NL676_018670 [Syzygium grande]
MTNRKTTDSELRGGGNHRREARTMREGGGEYCCRPSSEAPPNRDRVWSRENPRRVWPSPETARSSAGFGIGPANLRR